MWPLYNSVHTDVSKELFVPYLGKVDEKHCVLLPCELKWQITRKRRYKFNRFYGGHMTENNNHLKHWIKYSRTQL